MATVFTIGHSNRSFEDFAELLTAQGIQVLVDIRAFPMSRRLPHFNRESLEQRLPELGVEYVWMKELGGRRRKIRDDSPHVALRSDSFRNYADYMLTPAFDRAMEKLLALAASRKTAIMCAEAVYFHCHRMLVSDWLAAHGHEVLHIQSPRQAQPHRLTPEARIIGGQLVYRGDHLF